MVQSVCKLSLAASIYHIWRERNARIFKQKMGNVDIVVQQIVSDVRGLALAPGGGFLDQSSIYKSALIGTFQLKSL